MKRPTDVKQSEAGKLDRRERLVELFLISGKRLVVYTVYTYMHSVFMAECALLILTRQVHLDI